MEACAPAGFDPSLLVPMGLVFDHILNSRQMQNGDHCGWAPVDAFRSRYSVRIVLFARGSVSIREKSARNAVELCYDDL